MTLPQYKYLQSQFLKQKTVWSLKKYILSMMNPEQSAFIARFARKLESQYKVQLEQKKEAEMEIDEQKLNNSLNCSISGNNDSQDKNQESDIPVLEQEDTQPKKGSEDSNYESDAASSPKDRFHLGMLNEQGISSEHENDPSFGIEHQNLIPQQNETIEQNCNQSIVIVDELSQSKEERDEEQYVPPLMLDEEEQPKQRKNNKIKKSSVHQNRYFPPSEQFQYGLPDYGFGNSITANNLNRQTSPSSQQLSHLNPKQSGNFQTHKSYRSPVLNRQDRQQERIENNNMKQGRQYSEQEKRIFVKKVLDEMKKQSPQRMKQIVRLAAHHAEIQIYVMKTWINAYKIVFNIEALFREKKLQPDMSLKRLYIENQMRSYAAKNKNEKRYRIIKVIGLIFQIFNIPDSPSIWFTAFQKKYHNEIFSNPDNLDKSQKTNKQEHENRELHLGGKINKNEKSSSFESEGEQCNKKSLKKDMLEARKKGHIQKQPSCDTYASQKQMKPFQNNSQSFFTPIQQKSLSGYPMAFQKKVCSGLDQIVEQKLNELFKNKSSQYSLSFDTLKQIYFDHGAINFRKKETNNAKSVEKIQPPIQSIHVPSQNEKKISEKKSSDSKKIIEKPKMAEKSIEKLQFETNTQSLQKNATNNQTVQKSLSTSNVQIIPKAPQKPMEPPQSKNAEVKNNSPLQIQSQEGIKEKNQFLKRLQNQLLFFLQSHKNQTITIASLQNENERLMSLNGFSQSLKGEVRAQWFAMFLKFNKYIVNPEKKVVKISQNENGNKFQKPPQSSNITPPSSRPGLQFQGLKVKKGSGQVQQFNEKPQMP